MARRYRSLHHNLKEGENVVFHREHRSKKGRAPIKPGRLQKWKTSDRHKINNLMSSSEFLSTMDHQMRKKKRY